MPRTWSFRWAWLHKMGSAIARSINPSTSCNPLLANWELKILHHSLPSMQSSHERDLSKKWQLQLFILFYFFFQSLESRLPLLLQLAILLESFTLQQTFCLSGSGADQGVHASQRPRVSDDLSTFDTLPPNVAFRGTKTNWERVRADVMSTAKSFEQVTTIHLSL